MIWQSLLWRKLHSVRNFFCSLYIFQIQILLPALALATICYGQLARYGGGGGGGGGGPGRTGGGGGGGGGGSDGGGGGSLEESIPGTPGVDYPVYAEAPDTGFSCDGRVS